MKEKTFSKEFSIIISATLCLLATLQATIQGVDILVEGILFSTFLFGASLLTFCLLSHRLSVNILIFNLLPGPVVSTPLFGWETAKEFIPTVSGMYQATWGRLNTIAGKVPGTLEAEIALRLPETTGMLARNAIKVGAQDPKAIASLAREFGRAATTAYVQDTKSGNILVNAAVKGAWEVIVQSANKRIKKLNQNMKSTAAFIFKWRKSAKEIPAVTENGASNVGPLKGKPFLPQADGGGGGARVVAAAAAAADNQALADNAGRTWFEFARQNALSSFEAAQSSLSKVQEKLVQVENMAMRENFRLAVLFSKSDPRLASVFGESIQGAATAFMKDLDKSKPLAKNMGKIMADEYLKNPAAAREAVHYIIQGSAPVLYKFYLDSLYAFLKNVVELVRMLPIEAMDLVRALGREIAAEMKLLMKSDKAAQEFDSHITNAVSQGLSGKDHTISASKVVAPLGRVAAAARRKRDEIPIILTKEEMLFARGVAAELEKMLIQYRVIGNMIYGMVEKKNVQIPTVLHLSPQGEL